MTWLRISIFWSRNKERIDSTSQMSPCSIIQLTDRYTLVGRDRHLIQVYLGLHCQSDTLGLSCPTLGLMSDRKKDALSPPSQQKIQMSLEQLELDLNRVKNLFRSKSSRTSQETTGLLDPSEVEIRRRYNFHGVSTWSTTTCALDCTCLSSS